MGGIKSLLQQLDEIHQTIREKMNLIPELRYKIIKDEVIIDTSYYDKYTDDDEFTRCSVSLASKLAFEINDYDCPTKKSDARKFCEFMGFDDEETKAIIKVCSDDEAYDNWSSGNLGAFGCI